MGLHILKAKDNAVLLEQMVKVQVELAQQSQEQVRCFQGRLCTAATHPYSLLLLLLFDRVMGPPLALFLERNRTYCGASWCAPRKST